jgi:hypothetical protein
MMGISLIEQEKRYNVSTGQRAYNSLIYAVLLTRYHKPGPFFIDISPAFGDIVEEYPLPLSNNKAVSFCFRAVNAKSLALVWIDPPANEDSPKPLINDLDIILVSEFGMLKTGTDKVEIYEVLDFADYGAELEVFYRAYVYAFDGFTMFDPVEFSIHVNARVSLELVECAGECEPGTTESCGGSGIKQCNTDGSWTLCEGCSPGYRIINETCQCDPSLLFYNGSILQSACGDAYAIIPDDETPDTGGSDVIDTPASGTSTLHTQLLLQAVIALGLATYIL